MYCCTHRFYTWPLVSVRTHLTVRAAEQLSRYYKLHVICVISLSAEFLVERQHQLWHSRAMRKMFPSIIPWCCWRVNSSVNWQTQNQNHFRFCRNTFDIFCPSGITTIRPYFICGEKACCPVFSFFFNLSMYICIYVYIYIVYICISNLNILLTVLGKICQNLILNLKSHQVLVFYHFAWLYINTRTSCQLRSKSNYVFWMDFTVQ